MNEEIRKTKKIEYLGDYEIHCDDHEHWLLMDKLYDLASEMKRFNKELAE